MMTLENIYAALFYTTLMFIVSMYYYTKGKESGIRETIQVFHAHEPAALIRMRDTIRKNFGLEETDV
ncbi:hypothetical protein UFOVP247_77 [uncultured Caudovirales phage]|uniref:Uncharacterized protein n=1 Tax=uncultured Caudovirales phage TaxID=2100421 RepID=A0A6J7WYB5_9CAUD|nr:hypothetical protein UFOVP247_77 [uncultured Caudovirales phage]